jgi:transposase
MPTLLPAPQTLDLVALHADRSQITIVARSCATGASCPLCGQVSTRIHSQYHRQVLDLPWIGVSVRLDLTVRRFFCDTPSCERQIFTERLPEVVAPSARRTLRLTAWLSAISLALGGAAGSRLLRVFGVMQSRSTLLRQVSALSLDAPLVGPAIGIDEFAFRRGRRFGTIIVELATRRVVELLPTVEAEQVIAWLRAHPQIQVVSRDPQLLTERQQSALRRVLEKDAALPLIYEQIQAFRQLLRAHDACRLDTWLEQAQHSDCAQLRAYALGLRKDIDAVRAGVRELYSQGPVEGQVHRIKLIKRSGYGRMSFPLLRQRVLLSIAS